MTYKVYNGSSWVELALKSDVKTYYHHHVVLTHSSAVVTLDFNSSKSTAYNLSTLQTLITTRGNSGELAISGFLYDRAAEVDCILLSIKMERQLREYYFSIRAGSFDMGQVGGYSLPTTTALGTSISDTVTLA